MIILTADLWPSPSSKASLASSIIILRIRHKINNILRLYMLIYILTPGQLKIYFIFHELHSPEKRHNLHNPNKSRILTSSSTAKPSCDRFLTPWHQRPLRVQYDKSLYKKAMYSSSTLPLTLTQHMGQTLYRICTRGCDFKYFCVDI